MSKPHVRVEYDTDNDFGCFIYIPVNANIEEAFEERTKLPKDYIAYYSKDDLYTEDGEEWYEQDLEDKQVDGSTIECQLFSWSGWDGDQQCMTFYGPVLKVPIGKHPVGTKFDCAVILWDKSVLQLINNEKEIGFSPVKYCGEYKLKLSVGEVIFE